MTKYRRSHQYGFNTHRNFLEERQGISQPTIPLVVGAAFLSSYLLSYITPSIPSVKPKLENHPMCGITTGGQEECYFDCKIHSLESPNVEGLGSGQLIDNVECLKDCFPVNPEEPGYCATDLLVNIINGKPCATNFTLLSTEKCITFLRTQRFAPWE